MTAFRNGESPPASDPASTVQPDWIQAFEPFQQLPEEELASLARQARPRRFALGEIVLRDNALPDGVLLVQQGLIRVLGKLSSDARPRTLDRLGPGSILGWISLVRAHPCEQLRAISPVSALHLPADAFLDLLERRKDVARWFDRQLPVAEMHQLLLQVVQQQPLYAPLLEHWLQDELGVELISRRPDEAIPEGLNRDRSWWISSGGPMGQSWDPETPISRPPGATSIPWLRLICLPAPPRPLEEAVAPTPSGGESEAADSSPEQEQANGALVPSPAVSTPAPWFPPVEIARPEQPGPLSLPRATGPRDVPMAIAQSLARYFDVPCNRDSLRDMVESVLQRQSRFNLVNTGQMLDFLGLKVVFTRVPLDRLHRVPAPAVLEQHGQLVLLDGVDPDGLVRILEPELGPLRLPTEELEAVDGQVEILLLRRKSNSPQDRFGWSWFLPYIRPHRRELIEVLAASFVVNSLALVTPLGLQVLIDQVTRSQNMGALLSISALLLLAGVATAVVRTLRTYVFAQLTNRIDQDGKSTILDQLVRLPQDFFDNRPVGQITYYFHLLDRLREFLVGQSLTTLVDFGFAILYIFILLALNPLLTLVALSTLPLIVILALVSGPSFEHHIKTSMGEAMRTYSYLNEAITGIQTIKSQNAELKTRWEFQNRYARFIGEDFKLKLTTETIVNIARFINDLNALLVIGFGIWLVMQNQMTLGGFIAFRIISSYISGPMMQLVQTWQQFRITTGQLQSIGDIVNRVPEQTEQEASNFPMPPVRGHVQLESVSFRFSDDAPEVLHNVNLDIPEGCFVGMVGGSGSGKSTVLKLLPRFYRAQKGKVMIDGFDVSKVELYSLRRQVGVVPQDSLLFDGTIRENLLLVKPDATADEIIQAAKIACAHEFIMEMPQGYNSSVGERGAGLSGGQRQRLAIARAVLQNPRMLIFDEATSALDARTERRLCQNLFEAFRGRTVFFITHRLSTVRNADKIVLMDRGAVMEVGTHDELMQLRGWYYALFESQSGRELS